jgi:uncharacterized OB-fold protein
MAKKKETVSCKACGSEYVVRDAWVEWDYKEQDWVIKDVFDYAHCEDCNGKTELVWKELTEEEED